MRKTHLATMAVLWLTACALGQQVTLLDVTRVWGVGSNNYPVPRGFPRDLTAPVNYMEGTLCYEFELMQSQPDGIRVELCMWFPNATGGKRGCICTEAWLQPMMVRPGIYRYQKTLNQMWHDPWLTVDYKRGMESFFADLYGGRTVSDRAHTSPKPSKGRWLVVFVARGSTYSDFAARTGLHPDSIAHLSDVAAMLQKQQYGQARIEAEKHLARADETVAGEARRIVDACDAYVTRRRAEIADCEGEPAYQADQLAALAALFQPSGVGKALAAEARAMDQTEAVRRDRQAIRLGEPLWALADTIRAELVELDESVPELRNKPGAPKLPPQFAAEAQTIVKITAELKARYPQSATFRCAEAMCREFGLSVP